MKKAIIYARVSTDEQAENGFSREEQSIRMHKYCVDQNITIVATYLEDFSAKTFNRPAFNKMLEDLKSKKVVADTLLVTKIDRFTRNLFATFGVLEQLQKFGVTVYSLAEGELDYANPHKFFPLIIQAGAAQYDNMIRSDNTKRGMRQAMKNGRCVSTPPKGYINDKITKLINVDIQIAPVIKWSFVQYAKGIYSAEEIRRDAVQKGLKLTKQTFLNMLKNPIYIGKILVPASKDEPEELVNGLHDPIIDEETFYTVQKILIGKRKPYKQPKDDIKNALPLRGLLICPTCGRTLTGSTPKGNGGKYPYYHCQQIKYGCKCRFSAKNAHIVLQEYLKTFEPTEEVINLFANVLSDIFYTNDKNRFNQKAVIEKEINDIKTRINNIDDQFADRNIPFEKYKVISKRYDELEKDLIMQKATLYKIPDNFDTYMKYSCGLMQNLSYYYSNALPSVQNKLIGLIFPEKLTFTGNKYKTNKINEIFNLKINMDKGLQKNSPAKIARLYKEAPPSGLEPETL